ncbi:MAG TPA: hypothetical protein VE133_04200 [Candidatus Sulfotelmatobacter sp.]|nr:hypothetical protein [Candidatus Sulfotelmatobacter sp.]
MAIETGGLQNTGTEGALERALNPPIGSFIHIFLSVLAILVMAAACISLFEMVYHDFPQLWKTGNEYQSLHQLLQSILLLAIAGELGLLLLFHRTSAAVEVVMFVIARRMVATDVTSLDLLMGSAAMAILLAVRFYYLPNKPK